MHNAMKAVGIEHAMKRIVADTLSTHQMGFLVARFGDFWSWKRPQSTITYTYIHTHPMWHRSNGNLALLTRLLAIVAHSQYMGWGCVGWASRQDYHLRGAASYH